MTGRGCSGLMVLQLWGCAIVWGLEPSLGSIIYTWWQVNGWNPPCVHLNYSYCPSANCFPWGCTNLHSDYIPFSQTLNTVHYQILLFVIFDNLTCGKRYHSGVCICIFFNISEFMPLFPYFYKSPIYIFVFFCWVCWLFLTDLWDLFAYYKISPFPAYRLQILAPDCLLTFDLVNGDVFQTYRFFNIVNISILSFMTSMFCVIFRKPSPTLRF